MGIITSRLRLLILMLGVVLIALLFWFAKGKKVFEAQMQDWVHFQIPSTSQPLNAEMSVRGRTVTVCNREDTNWTGILIRIDGGYIKELEKLNAGECVDMNVAQFAYPTWKRLPPPNNLVLKTVEVLASVQRVGYAKKHFE